MRKFIEDKLNIPDVISHKYTGFVQMLSDSVVLTDKHVFVYDHDFGPLQIMDDGIYEIEDHRGWAVEAIAGSTIKEVMASHQLVDKPFSVWLDCDEQLKEGIRYTKVRLRQGLEKQYFIIDLHDAINWRTYRQQERLEGVYGQYMAAPIPQEMQEVHANAQLDAAVDRLIMPPAFYGMPKKGKKMVAGLKRNEFHSKPLPLP